MAIQHATMPPRCETGLIADSATTPLSDKIDHCYVRASALQLSQDLGAEVPQTQFALLCHAIENIFAWMIACNHYLQSVLSINQSRIPFIGKLERAKKQNR